MHWILDLELLLLISRIARKWNRAKTFFVRTLSLPKNPFLLRQEISREQGLWLLIGDYKKMFLLVQTYLGGQSYCSPHLTPQIQCLPGGRKTRSYVLDFNAGIVHNILCETKTQHAKIYLRTQCTNWQISYNIN
jgi:hypothetical protein